MITIKYLPTQTTTISPLHQYTPIKKQLRLLIQRFGAIFFRLLNADICSHCLSLLVTACFRVIGRQMVSIMAVSAMIKDSGLQWLSLISILNMKKLQNYLMKPEELRKKLENPRFRQDFIDWTKNNTSIHRDASTKHSRSRSPVQNIQRSIQLNPKRNNSSNKENMRPQSVQRQHSVSKQSQRTPISMKTTDKMNRSEMAVKRNVSNASLSKAGTQNKSTSEYLNSKNRYNSCTSIDYQKRQKSSQMAPNLQKKLKQRYSYRTRQGVQISNPNKVNQDSLVIKSNLAEQNLNLYAVADGHGVNGHLVSQYLVKNVGKCLQGELKNGSLTETIPKVFEKMQKGLTESEINATCSGSTFVSVFFDNDEIVCANVGDSRAILARQIDRKSWELIYLSQDHKPSIEAEKKRILKSGGRIHAFRDQNGQPIGPLRVWLPNQNLQGLAMSRSFGDNVSKPIGVNCEPQIIRMKIDKRDKFVLVASDGIWEFITNQEVLQLVVPYYKEGKLEEACDALSKLAYERWTCEDNSVVDDITFVLIFLQE